MWLIDQLAEARIGEAIERGQLQGLPGEGRPQVLDDDRLIPEELRAGYRLLKNAGFLPPELEPHRAIRDVEALLRAVSDQDTQTRSAAQRRLRLLIDRVGRQGGGRHLAVTEAYYQQLLERFGRSC